MNWQGYLQHMEYAPHEDLFHNLFIMSHSPERNTPPPASLPPSDSQTQPQQASSNNEMKIQTFFLPKIDRCITPEELKEAFSKFGEVVDIRLSLILVHFQ